MRFDKWKGPYDRWYDHESARTLTSRMTGSRIVREFYYCPKDNTVVWYDIRIDGGFTVSRSLRKFLKKSKNLIT